MLSRTIPQLLRYPYIAVKDLTTSASPPSLKEKIGLAVIDLLIELGIESPLE